MSSAVRVMHVMPDLAMGGGQQLLLRNISGMTPGAIEHHVASVKTDLELRARFEDLGCSVHPLNVRQGSDAPGAIVRLRSLVRSLGIDVIHTNNTGSDRRAGYLAASGRPVVNSLHAEAPGPTRSFAIRAFDRADGLLSRRAVHSIVAVSNSALTSWTPWLDAHRVAVGSRVVRHPGLDLTRFPEMNAGTRRSWREAHGLGLGSVVLVHVARLVPGKGVNFFLDALAACRAVGLDAAGVIVGDGPDRAMLESHAVSLGITDHARFLGPRDDVPTILAACDLMVFPSLSEGFGLAPLEAMAAGLPVAAFALPSLMEFIEPGRSGELVARADGEALSRAVVSLVRDAGMRRSFGDRSHAIVRERFDQRIVSAWWVDLYTSLAGRVS
ncbi:MAG: glycosyltransferase [Phycisphaerales bacterium]